MAFSKLLKSASFALLLLGIGVHLLFLLCLKLNWLNPLFNDSMHRFGPGADFFSIYAAGMKARAGESIYTVGGHVAQVPYAYAFRYAPPVAYTLGLAFSLVPALSAYALWLIVCELTLLRCIRLSIERAPSPARGYLVAALWLLFSPYFLELYVGQFTFVTAALVFQAYLAWEKASRAPAEKRELWNLMGDGWFALAVWLKMMPLLYLPIALWRKRWMGIVFTLLVLVLPSWFYFAHHPGDWAVFQDTNADPTPTWHAGNQGLMAFLFAAVGERAADFAQVYRIAMILVGCGLARLVYRLWRTQGEGAEQQGLWLYAACSAAYLLLYKDVWEHHYVLLLPPLALMALRREPAWVWLPPFLICALPTLYVLYDVRGLGYNEDPQRYWQTGVSLLHHGWKPLAPLWLFIGLLWRDAVAARRNVGAITRPEGAAESLPSRMPQWAKIAAGLAGCLLLLVGTRWAAGAISSQWKVTQQLTWPESVFQLQKSKQTCGPAALVAVCRHYNIPATEAEIATLAGTGENGTSMLGLQKAAQAKGLSAVGQECRVEELANLPRPSILYFHQGHFAVLTGVQEGRYYVADPSLGQRMWTREQLSYLWRGELLLVGPAH